MSEASDEIEVKPQNKTLNERQMRVVNLVEQRFWEIGVMPSYEAVAEACKEEVDYVRKVVEKNPLARKSLVVRGVDLRASESARVLTSEQLMAANVVLNNHDARSLREKLEFLGISSQQWHAWLRQPGFSQYMTKRAEEAFGAHDYAAYAALGDAVEEGKLDAVKLHFEMRGKYKQQVDVHVNIEQVLMQVVEVISRHIDDRDVLLGIAKDFETLMPGNAETRELKAG